jgi:hypothetical protein
MHVATVELFTTKEYNRIGNLQQYSMKSNGLCQNIFTTNHQYIYNNKLTKKSTFFIWVFITVLMPKKYLQQIDNIFVILINNKNNN